ncbi:MAG: hypothetical protein AB1599_06555 [Planctomycetota bacterium]
MRKSIVFLLMLGCIVAVLQIGPALDISADKPAGHAEGRSASGVDSPANRDKPKPLKEDREKPKHDKSDPKPSKSEDKSRLKDFSEPYKDKDAKHGKKSYDSSYDSDDYDNDSGDFWDEFWADLFSDIFSALIFGDFGYRYSSCPYNKPQQPQPGIYVSTNNELGNMTAFQFRTYYNTVDSNIKSYGLYGKLLFPSSWTWDMENNHYTEDVGNNNVSMNYFTTHFNTIGLTPNTNFVTEVGFGLAFLTDAADEVHSSGSFQVRADYFPAEPWSIRTSASFASPSDVRTTNFDATIGWHSSSLEIFGGYHSLINDKALNLNGPTFGMALWF